MLRAYERAALTLNFIRALTDGGFADLHHPEYWDVSFAQGTPNARRSTSASSSSIRESLDFVAAITGVESEVLRRVDVYTSHEALALPYEQAQTRQVPRRAGWYNLSTHFPWIGMRTAQLDGAHVEFHRGIRNPLGIKIGPAMTTEWLTGLLDVLDPEREPGRITLIHRMGAEQRARPSCRRSSRRCARPGRTVLWVCDPMHGNTETTPAGIKTRRFDNDPRRARAELRACTPSSARASAACTSSSPARTSPSASAARAASPRSTSSAPTRAASIRASTTSRRSRWRCGSRGTCARPEPMTAVVRILQSWGVPVAMTGVYATLAWSADTSTTGKAWIAIGLALVLVVWWLFRFLTENAALARAVSVGDANRVLELTERQLHLRKRARARAPYLVYRGLAFELRGDWTQALAAIDEARLEAVRASQRPMWQLLAASVRIAALVETGRSLRGAPRPRGGARARRPRPRSPPPPRCPPVRQPRDRPRARRGGRGRRGDHRAAAGPRRHPRGRRPARARPRLPGAARRPPGPAGRGAPPRRDREARPRSDRVGSHHEVSGIVPRTCR